MKKLDQHHGASKGTLQIGVSSDCLQSMKEQEIFLKDHLKGLEKLKEKIKRMSVSKNK